MGLQNLADIHPAGNAERIEHDVDRRAIFQERHVFHRHDLRHHALVAVPAGHFVAGLDLALHRDEDLDHLHHAGRQLVAALQLLDLVDEAAFKALAAFLILRPQGLDLRHPLFLRNGELPPLRARIIFQHRIIDDGVFLEALRSGRALSAFQHFRQPAVDVAVKDRLFVVAVLGQTLDLLALDRHGALVLLHAVAVEDAHFHHRAIGARRHAQRGIAHIRRLLAEDGAQQLLLRRHRALALRRDLADQDVARLHLGADIDDAGLVEVLQRLFGNVGNVARDLFRTQLGVARHHLEFLNVNGGEDVVADDPLRQKD